SDFPNPDDTNPPGHWGPVIRRALERIRSTLGPTPDPWRRILGPTPDPWRVSFAQALAQEVVDRATLMQEVADALPQAGETRGITILGAWVPRFIADCGTGKVKPPFPPPRHPGDDVLTLSNCWLWPQSSAGARRPRITKAYGMRSAKRPGGWREWMSE